MILLALAAAAITAPASAVVDARGIDVRLPAAAGRIVTLAPSLAELTDGAGAGTRLVGVSSFTDRPAWAKRLPVVATPGTVDMERLIELRPDLVVAWLSGNPRSALDRLAQLGIAVFATEPRRLEDIARTVRAIGALAGTEPIAQRTARRFEAAMASLPRARGRPRVFIEIWHEPLMTVSGASLMSDVVRRCGGENVFSKLPAMSAQVSLEQLYGLQPDFILASAEAGQRAQARAQWSRYPLLKAVLAGRVAAIDADLFQREGLGIAAAAQEVCRALVDAFGEQ